MRSQVFSIILLSFLVLACNRNERHPVPYYQFDVVINLNLPSYNDLLGVGGWAYIQGAGSRGVVVYRLNSNQFVAFDRHSPADPEGTCPSPLITNEDNFLQLVDPCSDATFSLLDGSPWSDSSYKEWGLRSYMTYFDGGTSLRVYNP
jgi:hypothetical protein